MGKRQRRKKWWKALLGISINYEKSLKLEVEFFFRSRGIDEDESPRYILKKGISISYN